MKAVAPLLPMPVGFRAELSHFERRAQLLKLTRFRSTVSDEATRSLADYRAGMKEGQSAIYYISGSSLDQLKSSPQLEGFRAKGIEVLLLTDGVDSFWRLTRPISRACPLNRSPRVLPI